MSAQLKRYKQALDDQLIFDLRDAGLILANNVICKTEANTILIGSSTYWSDQLIDALSLIKIELKVSDLVLSMPEAINFDPRFNKAIKDRINHSNEIVKNWNKVAYIFRKHLETYNKI